MLICCMYFTLYFTQPLFFARIYRENNAGLCLVRPVREDRFAYPAKIKERLMNLVCVGLVTYAKLWKAVVLSSSTLISNLNLADIFLSHFSCIIYCTSTRISVVSVGLIRVYFAVKCICNVVWKLYKNVCINNSGSVSFMKLLKNKRNCINETIKLHCNVHPEKWSFSFAQKCSVPHTLKNLKVSHTLSHLKTFFRRWEVFENEEASISLTKKKTENHSPTVKNMTVMVLKETAKNMTVIVLKERLVLYMKSS